VPTDAARGPWNPDVIHGAAVAALLAGAFEAEGEVVVRVLVELMRPVPHQALTISVTDSEGGRRVKRQTAVLLANNRPVAKASALRIRHADLALPANATAHPIMFDPAQRPDLDQPNRQAAKVVGWPSFDSLAMATAVESRTESALVKLWLRLLIPIVEGEFTTGTQRAVAAADFGAAGTSARLPFDKWTFMNADLTVSLSRAPQGDWIGLCCEGIPQMTGTGISVTSIHDAEGRMGQSAQSLLLESRS
jgi:Thioesterase-like superfamily